MYRFIYKLLMSHESTLCDGLTPLSRIMEPSSKSPSAEPASRKEREQEGNLASMLNEELVLVGLLVLLAGLLYTDAYYDAFGLQYQSLTLPTSYFVLKGLTAVLATPWLIVPYILSTSMLVWQSARSTQRLVRRKLMAYASLPVIIALAGWMAHRAGHRQALRDMNEATSLLPKVIELEIVDTSSDAAQLLMSGRLRLLYPGNTYTLLFLAHTRASDAGDVTRPHLFWFSNGQIKSLKTTSLN